MNLFQSASHRDTKYEPVTADEGDSFRSRNSSWSSLNPRSSGWCSKAVLIHLCVFLIWSIGSLVVFHSITSSERHPTNLYYSPAQSAIHYRVQHWLKVDRDEKSPYEGHPRESLDEAWHDLLQYGNIRFTDEEFDIFAPDRKDDGIHLPDGGWLGSFQFWHDLHCLKHLHKFIWSETYYPNLTETQLEDQRMHLEHCIDTLRQGAMCRADITPFTFRWDTEQPFPLANFTSPHECVDWNSLVEWMKPRSVAHVFEPGYLRHPTLGSVYTDQNLEEVKNLGIAHDHDM